MALWEITLDHRSSLWHLSIPPFSMKKTLGGAFKDFQRVIHFHPKEWDDQRNFQIFGAELLQPPTSQ